MTTDIDSKEVTWSSPWVRLAWVTSLFWMLAIPLTDVIAYWGPQRPSPNMAFFVAWVLPSLVFISMFLQVAPMIHRRYAAGKPIKIDQLSSKLPAIGWVVAVTANAFLVPMGKMHYDTPSLMLLLYGLFYALYEWLLLLLGPNLVATARDEK